jgi:hypothetical protein
MKALVILLLSMNQNHSDRIQEKLLTDRLRKWILLIIWWFKTRVIKIHYGEIRVIPVYSSEIAARHDQKNCRNGAQTILSDSNTLYQGRRITAEIILTEGL